MMMVMKVVIMLMKILLFYLEPFALGSYCFPFRLKLPHVIPGSFSARSSDPTRSWGADVIFAIKANLLGTDDMVVGVH
jgi:hypothetical protein